MAKKYGTSSNSIKMIKSAIEKDETISQEGKKRMIPIDKIDCNPDNATIYTMKGIEHLADGIRENGFNESKAIGVYLKKDGRYEIYDGERRFRAMQLLGKTEIPAVISLMPDEVTKAKKLIECNNRDREKTTMDLARSIVYYKEHVLDVSDDWKNDPKCGSDKQKKLADVFDKSGSTIFKLMKLVKLIPELQDLIEQNLIPYRALYTIGDSFSVEMQKQLYDMCVSYLKLHPEETVSEIRINQMINTVSNNARKEQLQANLEDSFNESATISVNNNDEQKKEGEQLAVENEDQKSEEVIQDEMPMNPPVFEENGKIEQNYAVGIQPAITIEFEDNKDNEDIEDIEHIQVEPAEEEKKEDTVKSVNLSNFQPQETVSEKPIDDELINALNAIFEMTEGEFSISDKVAIKKMLSRLNKRVTLIKTKLLD